MTFSWAEPSVAASVNSASKRLEMLKREIAQRAAIFYRLGYPAATAALRISANLAWEHHLPGHARPHDLDDAAIAALVASTYARRPR